MLAHHAGSPPPARRPGRPATALAALAIAAGGCASGVRPPPAPTVPAPPSIPAVPDAAAVPPPLPEPDPSSGAAAATWVEEGIASWYGAPLHGRPTASGETYDMHAMTAAHRTLPFGSVVHVVNLDNGLVATVRINDRGPFWEGRTLDLSRRAAAEIGMLGPGTARVRLTLAGTPAPPGGGAAGDGGAGGPPPAPGTACWMVQVGQYGDAEDAALVRRSLERDGHGPVRVSTGAGGLHRVRVGPLDSLEEAEGLGERLGGMLLSCAGMNL
ncbi:MAG: septal ring lytic transglycosylase RlpA family protein [Gammaproteobacteria bacterium]|nr:septal ring lytic transglycosylase RlpA family protein [Gammaproteobacteria bacterium]MDE0248131.1 septal ring lytic transglycosylase RlpA family protein [Gammaproteobacteria bacterium]